MSELKNIRPFVEELGGVVAVRHERYSWRGLRTQSFGADTFEVVVDFIAKDNVFAYAGINSRNAHALQVEKVVRSTDEYLLYCISNAADELLLLRLQVPTPQDREVAKEWNETKDIGFIGEELQALFDFRKENALKRRKGEPQRIHQAVMIHQLRTDTGTMTTMAAIGVGKKDIVARAYPGAESVAEMWNQRFQLALDNGGKPEEILEHWLERINGNTEDLSEPFEVEAEDAEDAAHAALVRFNDTIGMVIEV